MAGAFGLTPVHEKAVVEYLRFARYKREQRLRAVDGAIEDLEESRLVDDSTFSTQEVVDMVSGLKALLHSDVEAELIDSDHTQVMLLCQLFQKAQQWKLELEPKIDELENRQLLTEIAEFEQSEFSKAKSSKLLASPLRSKLDPLDDTGPAAVMRSEIRCLEEENRKLKDELREIKEKASSTSHEKDSLESTLGSTKEALERATAGAKTAGAEVTLLQQEVAAAQDELKNLKVTGSAAEQSSFQATEDKLASALHELLAVRADLDIARKDLEKKFSESNAYNNLKKILTTKNDQIKELRSKLSKHEGEK